MSQELPDPDVTDPNESTLGPGSDPDKARRLAAVNRAADIGSENGGELDIESVQQMSAQEAMDGTDWFMSAEVEDEGYKDIEVNVASRGERWVRFRVQSIGRERIDQIRRENRRPDPEDPKATIVDEFAANARITAEGLIKPDLRKADMRSVRGQMYLDPADALVARFAHKPGLIDQIAGHVIDVTGYNDGDVREVRAGKS